MVSKIKVLVNVEYENKTIKKKFDIEYENKEEILYIALSEIKLILINDLDVEKNNLTIFPKFIKLEDKKVLKMILKCELFNDWEVIQNYHTFE